MADEGQVKLERFNGQSGYVVVDSGAVPGELDDGDEVRLLVVDKGVRGRVDHADDRLSEPLTPADPGLLAARAAYHRSRLAVGEARRLLTSFERALHPNLVAMPSRVVDELPALTPRAPSESEVQDLLTRMRELAAASVDAAPRLRSELQLLITWGESMIARDFTSFVLAKVGPTTRAVEAMRTALDEDPTNPEALAICAAAIVAMATSNYRSLAEGRAGISSYDEAQRLLVGLLKHPGRADCMIAAEVVLMFLIADGDANPERATQLAEVRSRLPELRAAQPIDAAGADDACRRARGRLMERSSPAAS